MFVLKSKYDKIEAALFKTKVDLATLTNEWNSLVKKINKKGGEDFLENAVIGDAAFSDAEIKTLISLCHPDKHGGKESAVRITQKLLKLRG